MAKLIAAHTNLDRQYPGYINFTREDDGTVSVHVRGNPSIVEGVYVCGYARNRGEPGRCTSGDEHCNNYCNMAPEKELMQNAPRDCTHVREGNAATLTLSSAHFEALLTSATQVAEAA